jgi:hypothetical protein
MLRALPFVVLLMACPSPPPAAPPAAPPAPPPETFSVCACVDVACAAAAAERFAVLHDNLSVDLQGAHEPDFERRLASTRWFTDEARVQAQLERAEGCGGRR